MDLGSLTQNLANTFEPLATTVGKVYSIVNPPAPAPQPKPVVVQPEPAGAQVTVNKGQPNWLPAAIIGGAAIVALVAFKKA